MSRIVSLGEVVADVYRETGGSDLGMPLTARPGGAPANLAVAAARLGSAAGFVGVVGSDLFGDFIMRALSQTGVDVSGVRRTDPPTRTTLAFVEIDGSGERSFTFYRTDPAADELLSASDLTREVVSGAAFVAFGSIPLLREPSRSAVHEAARLAGELGVPAAFDVNLRLHLWESPQAAREAIEPLLETSAVVKLSDDEIGPLLDTESPERAAEALLERGASAVFVTSGPRGAYYATPRFSGSVPSASVRSVDPTGAGDAFSAAALVRLAQAGGEEMFEEAVVRDAAIRGCAAGALACTGFGAIGALPDREELERFLRETG